MSAHDDAVRAAAQAIYERRHVAVGMTYQEWAKEAAEAALKAAEPILRRSRQRAVRTEYERAYSHERGERKGEE